MSDPTSGFLLRGTTTESYSIPKSTSLPDFSKVVVERVNPGLSSTPKPNQYLAIEGGPAIVASHPYLGESSSGGKLPVWRAQAYQPYQPQPATVADMPPPAAVAEMPPNQAIPSPLKQSLEFDGCGKSFPTPIGLRNHKSRNEECGLCLGCKGRGMVHDCPKCPRKGCDGILVWGFGCNVCGPSAQLF